MPRFSSGLSDGQSADEAELDQLRVVVQAAYSAYTRARLSYSSKCVLVMSGTTSVPFGRQDA